MTEQHARTALASLSALERTAWLDVGCRALESGRGRRLVNDVFAEWMIKTFGNAPGYAGLHPSLRLGVVARTWRFDEAIKCQLLRARRRDTPIELWCLGSGFDARRIRLAEALEGIVGAYREFDLTAVLHAKKAIIQASPFSGLYGDLDFVEIERPEQLPDVLPQSTKPVLVVAEGLVDFLPSTVRLRLIERLKVCVPNSVLLLDSLSRAGTDYDNRHPQRYTGDKDLLMEPAPEDPSRLHAAAGWVTIDRSSLFIAMRDVLIARHPRLLGPFKTMPPPSSMRHLYEFHVLEPCVACDRTARGMG